jgi:hypothetical protein
MIKLIQILLKETDLNTDTVQRAKGAYKFPESFSEFKNYIKLKAK